MLRNPAAGKIEAYGGKVRRIFELRRGFYAIPQGNESFTLCKDERIAKNLKKRMSEI